MRTRRPRFVLVAGLAAVVAVVLGGCGVAAEASPASFAAASSGPAGTAGAAAAQTRGEIATALQSVSVQLGDATRPYTPAESGRLRDAPRSLYQVVLPDQPDAGWIVVYEFPDSAHAVDAGNEEAGYLGTGNGRVQFPLGEQHVIRQVGSTLVLFSWLPSASTDPTAGKVADALNTMGIGFTVPS